MILRRCEQVITPHNSGLQLVAAADTDLDPARVGLILNHVAALCDVCVLDLGWGITQVTRLVAQRCTGVRHRAGFRSDYVEPG